MSDGRLVSFRVGVADGVPGAAGQWAAALRQLGCNVYTVAGHGDVDRRITWLAHDSTADPNRPSWPPHWPTRTSSLSRMSARCR